MAGGVGPSQGEIWRIINEKVMEMKQREWSVQRFDRCGMQEGISKGLAGGGTEGGRRREPAGAGSSSGGGGLAESS